MPEIIVKGVDSADAMEQLEKLLGKDAMILKTVRRDGMVEITGTNDPVPAPPASSTPTEPFSHILAETLKKQHARDMGIAMDPTPEPAAPAQDAVTPPMPQEVPAKPQAHAQAQAQTQPQTQAQTDHHPAAFRMPQTGYLLVGPKGAGKSTLALQIATNLVQSGAPRPRLVFWGNGSRADGAFLAAKCQIMGLTMIYASDADLAHPDMFNATSDIIVAAPHHRQTAVSAMPAVAGFRTVLVVPAGLSTASYDRIYAAWPTIDELVFATHDIQPWSQDDQTHADTAKRRVIAISDQARILDGLSAPRPLSPPARAPKSPQAPSLFQKRWGGQASPDTPTQATKETGMPLLGTGTAMLRATPHQKYGAEQ